jgi:hypothetical protein
LFIWLSGAKLVTMFQGLEEIPKAPILKSVPVFSRVLFFKYCKSVLCPKLSLMHGIILLK